MIPSDKLTEPIISIITPSFRASSWLKLCIASVADQGVAHEHIIQDSCSDDGTQSWLAHDPRVKPFIEKDTGMYNAINRGLRRAQGAICSHLNCDEQYLPGTLGKVARFFETHPETDVLFGDAILVDRVSTPLSYRRTILPDLLHIRASHLNTLTCSTFFRRSLLDRGFYFDEKWKSIGDSVWMEKLLEAGVPMATIREPLSIFTFTGKNLGAMPLSEAEKAQMRGPEGRHRWADARAILAHRVRKALAGAYRPRNVEIDIFTLDSPNKRQRQAGRVSFDWPSRER